MMRIKRYIQYLALILMTIMLQACVSPKFNEEVQLGKLYFDDGDFKKAFHQLLPAAAGGNPKAQYAVGYMYYYGYGVSPDQESGLFWMQKAAECRYPPAIKALQLIELHQQPPSEIRQENYKGEIQEKTSCFNPRSVKKIIRAEGYALQLLGAYDLEEVKALQKDLKVEDTTVIWHAENNKKDWYVLMYGHYRTVADARDALGKLPKNLSDLHPWVRGLKGLG